MPVRASAIDIVQAGLLEQGDQRSRVVPEREPRLHDGGGLLTDVLRPARASTRAAKPGL